MGIFNLVWGMLEVKETRLYDFRHVIPLVINNTYSQISFLLRLNRHQHRQQESRGFRSWFDETNQANQSIHRLLYIG